MKREVWSCIELHVSLRSVEVWVDDLSMKVAPLISLEPDARLRLAALGVTGSHAEGATAIDMDEVVIAPARIGCLPP